MTSVGKICGILAWKKKIMLDESFPRTRASEARLNELSGKPNSGVMGEGTAYNSPYNCPHGEAPFERGTFIRLQVNKGSLKRPKGLTDEFYGFIKSRKFE